MKQNVEDTRSFYYIALQISQTQFTLILSLIDLLVSPKTASPPLIPYQLQQWCPYFVVVVAFPLQISQTIWQHQNCLGLRRSPKKLFYFHFNYVKLEWTICVLHLVWTELFSSLSVETLLFILIGTSLAIDQTSKVPIPTPLQMQKWIHEEMIRIQQSVTCSILTCSKNQLKEATLLAIKLGNNQLLLLHQNSNWRCLFVHIAFYTNFCHLVSNVSIATREWMIRIELGPHIKTFTKLANFRANKSHFAN